MEMMGDNNPVKISLWVNFTLLFPMESIVKICSPSKNPAIPKCHIKRNSLLGSIFVIIGLNAVPLDPFDLI
jgi:hypothetical protein